MIDLLLSNLDAFSFCCPVTLARNSSTMLNRSGKNGYSCLISYLRGKAFSLSFIEYDVSCGFFINALY